MVVLKAQPGGESGSLSSPFGQAIAEARRSLSKGGIPIGASLAVGDQVVAVGHNERVQLSDPTAHGEISCLRNAGRMTSYRESILYTTLAPCAMCAGAIVQFGIPRVVVGEDGTFAGELEWLRSRNVEVELLDDETCAALMSEFIRNYPAVWNEDIGVV